MYIETKATTDTHLSPRTIESGGAPYYVEVLTPTEFTRRGLDGLHQLSYALYRPDGRPQPIVPVGISDQHTNTRYIVAYSSTPIEDTQTQCSPEIRSETLRQFSTTAGLYKLEFGEVKQTDNGLRVPIEADALISWNGWRADELVGYISSLSFNPLTQKSDRINITEVLHAVGSQLASQENGGSNRLLAIMSPKVASFTAKTGVEMTPLGGHLRWRNQMGDLTFVAKNVFLEYPRYWGVEATPEDERPILWQVSPGFPNKGKV